MLHQVTVVFRVCDSRQANTPSGAPYFTAVSYMMRTASEQQLPCSRMRTEDDRVPRLDSHDALEQHRRRGIGDRRERQDDANRFCNLDQAALWKFANSADRTFVFDVVVDKLRRHHVLDGLVFQHSELGLFDRQSRQMLRLRHPREHHRLHNAIHVFLRALAEDRRGSSRLADKSFEVRNSAFVEGGSVLAHAHSSVSDGAVVETVEERCSRYGPGSREGIQSRQQLWELAAEPADTDAGASLAR